MKRIRIGKLGTLGAALAVCLGPGTAAAQVSDGISVGLTPTAERVFFDSDLLFKNSTYWGGRLGFNFGRHVGLQGYYLTSDAIELESGGAFDSHRFGGEVVVTFAESALTPFLRFGAGVTAFEDSVTSELLSATAGAGLRFDLFDRFQTQIYVSDLAFRGSDAAGFVDPGIRDSVPTTRTFHNLTLGAEVNLYLGGRPGRSTTDAFFERGLGGVSIPLEVFAGELRFSDELGLSDETVAGARLGLGFGPYVSLLGYYFGATENDFTEFDDFYGYGLEGLFNLTRPNASLTPFLVLGTGRLHLTPDRMAASGLLDKDQWTATLGGGVAINLDERIQLEASARNLLISRSDPTDTTSPDQLTSSWLLSGGLKVALGGSRSPDERLTAGPAGTGVEPAAISPPETEPAAISPPETEPAAIAPPETEPAAPAAAAAAGPEGRVLSGAARDSTAESAELARMRERLEMLERQLQSGGAVGTDPTNIIRFPAPPSGEVYIRYGPPGVFDRRDPAGAAPVTPATAADSSSANPTSPAGAAAVVPGQTTLQPGSTAGAAGDSLTQALTTLSERLAGLEQAQIRLDSVRAARELAEIDRRIREIEGRPPTTIVVPPAAGDPEVIIVEGERRARRGVFQGGGFEIAQIGLHTGYSFSDPSQALLGIRADLGSAFGGSARLVPDATFGVTGDGTFTINGHVEWPLPWIYRGVTPSIGGGLGIRAGREDADGNSDLELLIPNLTLGASRVVRGFEAYAAFQALDLLDDNRFVIGFRTRTRPRTSTLAASPIRREAAPNPVAPQPAPSPEDLGRELTPEEQAERERLAAERERLAAELADVEARIARRLGEAEDIDAANERARAEEARRRLAAESAEERARAHRSLLATFSELSVELESVAAVRQGDRGLTVEIGGRNVFASGSARLSAPAMNDIERVAAALVSYPDLEVSVEGHTDATGGVDLNQRLSEERARAVRDALVSYGVAGGRLAVAGYGEGRPLASNETTLGRARNRRVEIVLVGLGPAPGDR